jgi:hypothetical protein
MNALRAVLTDPVALLAIVVAVTLLGGWIVLAVMLRRIGRMRGAVERRRASQAVVRRMHAWAEQQRAIHAARRRSRPEETERHDAVRRSER